jgi:hypothetical protein
VGDRRAYECRGVWLFWLGRIFTTFEGALELFEFPLRNGSPRSSCASVHSDFEVGAADRPFRRFPFAGRDELKRHRPSSNAAITNGPAAQWGTWVGTIRSNASSQIDYTFGRFSTGGTPAFFGVWNAHNRRPVSANVGDTTSTWSFLTSPLLTYRAANSSNGVRVTMVRGSNDDAIDAEYTAIARVLSSSSDC